MGLGEKLMKAVVWIVKLGVTPAGIGPPVNCCPCGVPIDTPSWAWVFNGIIIKMVDAISRNALIITSDLLFIFFILFIFSFIVRKSSLLLFS